MIHDDLIAADMTAPHYLYAIRLPVNDYAIAYIGVTKNPGFKNNQRFYSHSRSSPQLIGQAVQACGLESVIFEVIESGTRDQIYAREAEQIVAFRTRWPNGYNITPGGYGCRDPLPSTRAKMSAAKKTPESIARLTSPEWLAHLEEMRKSCEWAGSPENLAHLEKVRKSPNFLAAAISPENLERLAALSRSPENLARLTTRNKTPKMRAVTVARNKSPEMRAVPRWNKGTKGLQVAWNRGKPFSAEVRANMSVAAKLREAREREQRAFAEPTPRERAVKNGERYYSGNPCVRGHTGRRYSSGGGCVDCAIEDAAAREPRLRPRKPRPPTSFTSGAIAQRRYRERKKIRDMAAELRELRGETKPASDAPCVVIPFPRRVA